MEYRIKDISGKVSNKERTHAGRTLLKELITEIYGKKELNFIFNENGKPLLDFCFFSISHSGNYVACAVDTKPIGIDIEHISRFKKRKKYMLFTPKETEFVNLKDSAERFLTLWTRKEAYVKLKGGKLADAADICLISDDLELINGYNNIMFTSKNESDFIFSIATTK